MSEDKIIEKLQYWANFEMLKVYKTDVIEILNAFKSLQQRIDKAIEYIKDCTSNPLLDVQYMNAGEIIKLLSILKDKEVK